LAKTIFRDGEMTIKHNCCKESKFEWISVNTITDGKDTLMCQICKRKFIEVVK
jgi:hypothetical protein